MHKVCGSFPGGILKFFVVSELSTCKVDFPDVGYGSTKVDNEINLIVFEVSPLQREEFPDNHIAEVENFTV